jgi:hypothetical protein
MRYAKLIVPVVRWKADNRLDLKKWLIQSPKEFRHSGGDQSKTKV